MANLYTPYDNGLFESAFQVAFILKDTVLPSPHNCGSFTMDNEHVIQGTKSAKLTIAADAAIDGIGGKGAFSSFNFRSLPGSGFFNIISLAPGRYQIKANFITLSGNPVADDDALICIGQMGDILSNPSATTWTDLGGGRFKMTSTVANKEIIFCKVSAMKDTLQELSYTWQDDFSPSGSYRSPTLCIFLKNSTGFAIPITGTKNLLVGGKLFFDEMNLDVAAPPCSLTFGAPAYNKTDETISGLNDGTITIHATGQGTLQYQLDAGSFQLSNLFIGIAPGLHTITVKDSSTCGSISLPVTILAGASGCTLAFGVPFATKTDETAVGANDGTVTVNATTASVNHPLQYSLDGGAFQLTPSFSGIHPGVHLITVKDAGSCAPITANISILAFVEPPPPPPVPPLVMDEKPVNQYNFISWFNVIGQIGFQGDIECINEFWDLPKTYRLLGFTKKHYAIAMQNEDFSFYINFDAAISYPSFSNLKVALITSAGVVKPDCGILFKDANVDGTYNIYATLNLDSSIPEGKYNLLIYDFTTHMTLFISSGLQVMTETNAKSLTARFVNRNTYDIYKYYYSRVPNYVNQIRMNVSVNDEEPEATIVNYRAVSSGRLRNVNIELDKWIQLETYFWDDNAIRGMYVFQICDTININGKNYILKDIYKTTWNPKLCVNKGLISFYEQEFSTANRFGIPGNLTIVGSDDPLLLGDNGGFIKL